MSIFNIKSTDYSLKTIIAIAPFFVSPDFQEGLSKGNIGIK